MRGVIKFTTVNPFCTELFWWKIIRNLVFLYYFSVFFLHWDYTGNGNPSFWKTWIYVFFQFNTMATNDHRTQWSHNIPMYQNIPAEQLKLDQYHGFWVPGGLCNIDIRPKRISNPNPMKSHLHITYFSGTQSFWHFAQSMAASLPWSVQNFKMIAWIIWMLCTNDISWDLRLRRVSDRYPILHRPPSS